MTPLFALTLALAAGPAADASTEPLRYVGEDGGAGAGVRVVLLAGDHEYRSEEILPALARVLAKRHGCDCTVLFTRDPRSFEDGGGEIDPAADHLPGLEALRDADLLVVALRFKDLPDHQMTWINDYFLRGGPVVGLRTATHAFKIDRPADDAAFARYHFRSNEPDWAGGFGRRILGETWVSHYGKNHVMSARLDLNPAAAGHPILRGVKEVWVESGAYTADPAAGSEVLAFVQPLAGMTPDAPPADGKPPHPGAWVRNYEPLGEDGSGSRRAFCTTAGASEDLRNAGFRRLVVNACLWAAGREAKIAPDLNVDLVGPYRPSGFSFGGHVKGVRPGQMAGWDTPIPPAAE